MPLWSHRALTRFAPRSASGKRFAAVGILLVAAIAGADWEAIAMQRAAAIEDYRIATTNLANAMASMAASSFGAIDRALRDLQAQLLPAADATPEQIQAKLHGAEAAAWLATQRQHLPGVAALALVSADGRLASATPAWPEAWQDVSGPDFFQHFRTSHDAGAFVGVPRQDIEHGDWIVVLARRLTALDGSFAGVVLAELSIPALEDFYLVAMPKGRSLTLLRRDGTALMRVPHQPGIVGRRLPDDVPWHTAVAAGGGTYLGPGYLDHVPILAVVRPVQGLPLVVEASVTQTDALAGWRRQRLWLILGGVVACMTAIALVRLFAAQMQRLAAQNVQLDDARRQLHLAMANMRQGLCFFDGGQRLILCNQRFGDIYHLPPAAMQPGTELAEIVDHCYAAGGPTGLTRGEYILACAGTTQGGERHESIIELADGRTISVQRQPMPDGGWVATHEDITERRQAEERIAFLARHDVLTGLANRSLLLERIGQSAGRRSNFAVLFLDLDRFKAVNDTLGHAAGDALLCCVAGRLLETVRDGDTVARLGGDEFVVLQDGQQTPDSAAALAERIIKAVAAPYGIGANEVVIGVSIGIDLAPSSRIAAEDLLKHADTALYIAKGEGRGRFRFFEPEMDAHVQNRHALERDLHCALLRGEFELDYQAIVGATTGQACGFEARLRWRHPVRGLIVVDEFIAVAEDTGLIAPIGEWMIARACREAANWPGAPRLCIALSPVQFRAANLVATVSDALATSGLAAGRLELKITEPALLDSGNRNLAVLRQLHTAGIGIVLDDFGVATSSLASLRRFPFQGIRIDRSFVADLTERPDAAHVVRAIIGLCRDLGIRATAEGVATAEQLAVLVAEGCPEMQGPLFSRLHPAAGPVGLLTSSA